jgi:biotin operon repressor
MPSVNVTVADAAAGSVLAGYVSETELARELGKCERTVQRLRALRKGPPYVLIGRQIYYRLEAVRVWLLAQERKPGRRASGRLAP